MSDCNLKGERREPHCECTHVLEGVFDFWHAEVRACCEAVNGAVAGSEEKRDEICEPPSFRRRCLVATHLG